MGTQQNTTVTPQSSDLLRVVANELKLPLTHIQATSSMLLNNSFDQAELEEQYQRLQINSQLSIDMIDALLLAGSVQTLQQPLGLEVVSAASVARQVVADLQGLALRYDRHIRVIVTDTLAPASANTVALKTSVKAVLESLIRSSRSEVIEVLVHNQTDRVMVTLRDEGKAITNQTVKNVLKNLGKSVQPAKSIPATAGLGVYVATILMESMNGRFDAYTKNNKRSITFSLQQSEQLSLL